jgi:hypothetical protein
LEDRAVPQHKYESCYVLEFNGDESRPGFLPVGRAALGGKTAVKWAKGLEPEEVVSDRAQLREIRRRLRIPDPVAAAYTLGGRPYLVFYD